jgi:hypothetical protein
MTLACSASLCLCASLILLGGCAVGWNHTWDATLEQRFVQHRAEFEQLLAEAERDSQLHVLQPRFLSYAGKRFENVDESNFSEIEILGMPRVRWNSYQQQLKALKIAGGISKTEGRIEFTVDTGSLTNGDSYKGYEYRTSPPDHVLSSLDGYRISDQHKDKFGNWAVYKPLSGNWYLYLFVNR